MKRMNWSLENQVSPELLQQMRNVDYEAVRKDLTLLMTDSKVRTIAITGIIEYFPEIPFSWKFPFWNIISYGFYPLHWRTPGRLTMVTMVLSWWGWLGTVRDLTGGLCDICKYLWLSWAKLKLVQFNYLNLSRRSDGRGGVDGGRQRWKDSEAFYGVDKLITQYLTEWQWVTISP